MSLYLYEIADIQALRAEAMQAGLSIPESFMDASDELLQRCYNGIGPDRWSSRFRNLTTYLLEFFEADALIHDYEYSLPDKSYFQFTVANLRFIWNAAVLAFVRHGGCGNAIRITLLGCLLGLLCQLFGYGGYQEGAIINKEKKK